MKKSKTTKTPTGIKYYVQHFGNVYGPMFTTAAIIDHGAGEPLLLAGRSWRYHGDDCVRIEKALERLIKKYGAEFGARRD